MGNVSGDLIDYWKLMRANPTMQGGFIWDFVDQGLWKQGPDGKRFFAYGGDFGDQPNDGNFNINGIVDPDREPHPMLAQVRKTYQSIHVAGGRSRRRGGSGSATNTPSPRWTATSCIGSSIATATPVASGDQAMPPVAPGQSRVDHDAGARRVSLCDDGHEYAVTLSFRLRAATAWAKSGLCRWPGSSSCCPPPPRPGIPRPRPGKPTIARAGNGYRISGHDFALDIDGTTGRPQPLRQPRTRAC